jgi:hypothetical protein
MLVRRAAVTRNGPAVLPCSVLVERSYDYSGMMIYDVVSGTPRWQVFYW